MYTLNYSDAFSVTTNWQTNVGSPQKSVQSGVITGVRSGESVPDWREKVRRGEDASSSFTSDRKRLSRLTAVGYNLVAHCPGVPDSGYQTQNYLGFPSQIPTSLGHLSPDQPVAEADALRKLYAALDSQLTHMSGASALAELGDVIRQFGRPFKGILDLLDKRITHLYTTRKSMKLANSDLLRNANWKRVVGQTYLEFSFGLIPLIDDTRKAAEALARFEFEQTGEFRRKARVRGRGISTASSSTTEYLRPVSHWANVLRTDKVVTERRVQYVAGIGQTLQADFGSNDRLLQLLGFKPRDWIPAVWEVVPWSWLVDYFANVGSILKAAATSTADVTWCVKTVTDSSVNDTYYRVDPSATSTFIKVSWDPWRLMSLSSTDGGFRLIRKTVTRTPHVQLGLPPLVFGLPSMLGQLANMAAVVLARRPTVEPSLRT